MFFIETYRALIDLISCRSVAEVTSNCRTLKERGNETSGNVTDICLD